MSFSRSCGNARTGGRPWNAPDREQLRHYRAYCAVVRGVLIRSSDGPPVGAAMVIRSEIVTSRGDRIPADD